MHMFEHEGLQWVTNVIPMREDTRRYFPGRKPPDSNECVMPSRYSAEETKTIYNIKFRKNLTLFSFLLNLMMCSSVWFGRLTLDSFGNRLTEREEMWRVVPSSTLL